jgi:hypothetical protein
LYYHKKKVSSHEMALGIFQLQSEGIWEGVAEGWLTIINPKAFGSLTLLPPLKPASVLGTFSNNEELQWLP